MLLVFCFLLPAAPALADGSYCVCRTTAFSCTNHRANDVVPGGTVGGNITTAQCDAFCAGRGTGTTNVHLSDAYAGVVSTCSSQCVDGGSCTAASGAPGIPALNTCIAGGAIYRDVETLERCCQYLRSGGESAGGTVGYSGTTQSCGADTVPGEAVSSTTAIRLFNPLGRDTDIPAFIGRGIRGVLGIIGAIALLMFVYGGVTWMTAGDSKRVEDAKNIIKNSVIGLLLIFFSYNLIGIFFDFFSP
ncbi:hypothetical protein IT087_00755 [Candidatus Uhrbacteria bacterium]|nr:hypothetical protein [Candidatus Uhrbacteria bacterium]